MNPLTDRATFLEQSPYESDGGNLIGLDPRSIPVEKLRSLGGPTTPGEAIRAKCIDCCGGQLSEVRKCVAVNCALWPYRMGVNPFHGRRDAGKNTAANLDPFQAAGDVAEELPDDNEPTP
jgi:hypothetical protein